MSHSVFILNCAQKELIELPISSYRRVRNAIRRLAQNPRPAGCLRLTGRPAWRLRVGDYRVIYEVDDKEKAVTVVHIGHRRDVYRQR